MLQREEKIEQDKRDLEVGYEAKLELAPLRR